MTLNLNDKHAFPAPTSAGMTTLSECHSSQSPGFPQYVL